MLFRTLAWSARESEVESSAVQFLGLREIADPALFVSGCQQFIDRVDAAAPRTRQKQRPDARVRVEKTPITLRSDEAERKTLGRVLHWYGNQ